MSPLEKLLDFFRREFQAEECSGFQRLSRIPGTYAIAVLAHYRSLSEAERLEFIDCAAHWSCALYGFVIGSPEFDHTDHPYFREWSHAFGSRYGYTRRSVPSLRADVQQYRIDARRGIKSSVSREDFEYASSIRSVKAPELRKRVRSALLPLGYFRKDKLGYCCRQAGREFRVHVSHGGQRERAQLTYAVARPDFGSKPCFSFENALGFVMGNDWDYIVEDSVDDVFSLFTELVAYSYALPDRIRKAVA